MIVDFYPNQAIYDTTAKTDIGCIIDGMAESRREKSLSDIDDIDDIINETVYVMTVTKTVPSESDVYKQIAYLKEEKDMLKRKMSYDFPVALVTFMCGYCTLSIASIMLIVLQLVFNFKVLDFYILFLVAVASVGLFATSIAAIREFRKKINEG